MMPPSLELRLAEPPDIESLHRLIALTINTCYPKAYSPEAVDFFLHHHSLERLNRAISGEETVFVLSEGEELVGTGTLDGNEITRVFVNPARQGEGLGTVIMKRLEQEATERSLERIELDASLVSISYYAALGYENAGDFEIDLEDGGTLPYQRMVMQLTVSK